MRSWILSKPHDQLNYNLGSARAIRRQLQSWKWKKVYRKKCTVTKYPLNIWQSLWKLLKFSETFISNRKPFFIHPVGLYNKCYSFLMKLGIYQIYKPFQREKRRGRERRTDVEDACYFFLDRHFKFFSSKGLYDSPPPPPTISLLNSWKFKWWPVSYLYNE